MGPDYPVVFQGSPRMVSSLRATVKSGAHSEPRGADPNDKPSDSNFQMMKPLTLILMFVRLDNQNSTLERNLRFVPPAMIHRTASPSFETSPDFCVVDPGYQGGGEVDVRSEGVQNEQVSCVSANAAEKLETRIETLELASTGAPLPRKTVLAYTEDDMVNDSSPIALSDKYLSSTERVETTKALSERVDRVLA